MDRANIADWSRLIRNDPSVTECDAMSHSVTNVCDTLGLLFVTRDDDGANNVLLGSKKLSSFLFLA